MKLLNKIQNKGIERIIRDRVTKYAMDSGVSVDLTRLEITFYDHTYGVKISYESENKEQLKRFERMLDEDPYLKGHI